MSKARDNADARAALAAGGSGINVVAVEPLTPSTDDVRINTATGQLKCKTVNGKLVFEAFNHVLDV